jgi:Family of unknown function (DUF6353)
MNIQSIKDIVTSKAARTVLLGKKHSPLILTVSGIAGLVGSAVLASKATLELEHTLTEFHSDRELVRNARRMSTEEQYSKQQYAQGLVAVHAKGAFGLIKLYGPAVTLATASIVSIMGAHNILSKRNAAIAAAYKTVESAYKRYRDRVVEEYGEEIDHNLRHGVKLEKVQTEDENGKKVVTKVPVVDPAGVSQYSRFFDESNPNWERNPHYNKTFLVQNQRFMNDKLRAQGHLFLNEVYDALGFERTSEGSVVGWIFDRQDQDRDSFIDFGLFDVVRPGDTNERRRAFVNGDERSILLDFNPDGVIWDLI